MMTKDEKKELFLLLIESWFDDKTETIKSDNCIGFYHYLLDCLEFEEEFNRDYDDSIFNDFISAVVKILSNFPHFCKDKILSKEELKKSVIEINNKISPDIFDSLLSRVKDLYVMFREEYLI